jgi:hypothetical protein
LIYPALLEDLPWLLPTLVELDPKTANYICSTVLDQLPFDDECAWLLLHFLYSVSKVLIDAWPAIFGTKKIVGR